MKRAVSIFLTTAFGFTLMAGVAFAAPSNDSIADAAVADELPFVDARSTSGATVEPDEPEATCSAGGAVTGASVWYRLGSVSGPLVINTFGSKFDTVLSVHVSEPGYEELACSDDVAGSGGHQSRLTFSAEQASVYLVRVAGYEAAQGFLKLTIESDVMAFDAFAHARQVGALPFSADLDLSAATTEAGEPPACGGDEDITNTVWFKLSVPTVTSITADSSGAMLSIFEGTTLGTLSYVSCNQYGSEAIVKAVPDKVYYIQIGMAWWSDDMIIPFSIKAFTPPANDDFRDAITLEGFGARHEMSTEGASDEPDEPYTYCSYGAGSVWYKITSAETDALVVTTKGSTYDTVVAVYSGDSPEELQVHSCNDDSASTGLQAETGWTALAGVTYHIQVSGYGGRTGDLVVEVARGVTVDEGFIASGQAAAVTKADGSLTTHAGGGALVAGGSVAVALDPDGETSAIVCGFAVIIGTCFHPL